MVRSEKNEKQEKNEKSEKEEKYEKQEFNPIIVLIAGLFIILIGGALLLDSWRVFSFQFA